MVLNFNKYFGKFLVVFILILAVFGVISTNNYNFLPSKSLLIAVVFLIYIIFFMITLLIGKFTINKSIFIITSISLIYIFITFFNSIIIHKVYFLDYFVAYLSFVYLLIIALLYNKIEIDIKLFKKFFTILVLLFFLKYSISKMLGFMHRPGIFTENNYELLFLSLLILAYYHIFKKLSFLLLSLIFLIYILAGSRSGILILTSLLILIYLDFSKKKNFLIFPIVLIISIVLVAVVIKYRMPSLSIEDIDRFHFLMVFLKEISNWNILDFLFGKHPLTPLSYESCQELSFYKSLFSYSGDNICYAIILHSYILRIIFNHGIFGFLFVFLSIYKIILLSGYSKKETFIVLLLLFINGLSVSSVNNIFTVIGILFLTNLGYYHKKKVSQNVPKFI